MPPADPHAVIECFELDQVCVWRNPSVIGKHCPGIVAENNIVFEDRAILIKAVGDDLPTAPMTEKATDFGLCQRGRSERRSISCIDTSDALEGNTDPRKFCRDSS